MVMVCAIEISLLISVSERRERKSESFNLWLGWFIIYILLSIFHFFFRCCSFLFLDFWIILTVFCFWFTSGSCRIWSLLISSLNSSLYSDDLFEKKWIWMKGKRKIGELYFHILSFFFSKHHYSFPSVPFSFFFIQIRHEKVDFDATKRFEPQILIN